MSTAFTLTSQRSSGEWQRQPMLDALGEAQAMSPGGQLTDGLKKSAFSVELMKISR
jgi:hypothetical protein